MDGKTKSSAFACGVCCYHARRYPARTGCSGTYPSDASVFVSPSSPFAQRFEIRICPSLHKMSLHLKAKISDERRAVAAQVRMRVKWSVEARDFRIASVCAGEMIMAR